MWPNLPSDPNRGPGYPPSPGYPVQQNQYPQQQQYPQAGYPPPSVPSYPGQGFGNPPVSGFPNLPQQTAYPASPHTAGFQQGTGYPATPTTGFQQGTPYPGNQSPYPGNQNYPGSQPYPGSTPYRGSQPYPAQPQQPLGFGQSTYYPANQTVPPASGYPPAPQQQVPCNVGYPSGAHQHDPTPGVYPTLPQQANYSNPIGAPATASSLQQQPKMQQYQDTPTVRHSGSDPLSDAQTLRKAMKGFGTDEAAIINVLTKRTSTERIQIAQAFKQSFGKDLIKDLKNELSGRLEVVVLALMTPHYDYMAQHLHKAIAGAGTRELSLIDVLCTSTNQEIQAINASYVKLHGRSLEKDLSGDTSGHFRRLMVSMSTGGRMENANADPAIAVSDAQNLLKAGEKKWGTDESSFNAVLATRSWAQLRLMFHEYEKLSGHPFERAIRSEFSGDIEQGMLAIVRSAQNRAAYFAGRLHDSIAGLGTKDDDLIFIIVTRSEVDLESIKQEYHRMYNKSLAADVSGDTSGDYKKILLALIN